MPGQAMPPGDQANIVLARGVWVDPEALRFSYVRSSGPGGQSVNKLSSKAQLRVSVGSIAGLRADAAQRLRELAGRRLTREDELVFSSGTSRVQSDNREACLERLRALVARAVAVPRPRKASRPT